MEARNLILPGIACICLMIAVAYYAGMNQGDEDCRDKMITAQENAYILGSNIPKAQWICLDDGSLCYVSGTVTATMENSVACPVCRGQPGCPIDATCEKYHAQAKEMQP